MPYRDRQKLREYQRDWCKRKRAGLPTRTTKLLTEEEKKAHIKISAMKSRRRRRKCRRNQLIEKFGKCLICTDDYWMQLHRKDGNQHKKWAEMTNAEFKTMLDGNDYVWLCYNCHKHVHWCMEHLGMTWQEIQKRLVIWIL